MSVLSDSKILAKIYSKRDAKCQTEQNIALSELFEDTEFHKYIKKFSGKTDTSSLINFLSNRIKEKSTDFFNHLSAQQKQLLGLACGKPRKNVLKALDNSMHDFANLYKDLAK